MCVCVSLIPHGCTYEVCLQLVAPCCRGIGGGGWGGTRVDCCVSAGRQRGPPAQRLHWEAPGRPASQQRAAGEEAAGKRAA